MCSMPTMIIAGKGTSRTRLARMTNRGSAGTPVRHKMTSTKTIVAAAKSRFKRNGANSLIPNPA